ncbi:MAG: homoserine dehydrogenase [Desulfovibrionaceae bacterium]
MKPLRIGLAGCGTVGGGLARILEMNGDIIRRRIGRDIEIAKVAVRDLKKKRAVDLPDGLFTTNPMDLATDPTIDVVVELMGGTTTARDLVTAALAAGKHVVTANKALLARHGNELFDMARARNLHLCFEAAVAGGIPVIEATKHDLGANRLLKLVGILNGTANYILTEMTAKCLEFDTALAQAQALGYAEADPTLDIGGGDAAHKLILLLRTAFGIDYPVDDLPVHGITMVTPEDISFAAQFGYQIKLVAQARMVGDKIEAGVYPALIPGHYLLAKVQGPMNAVWFTGNAVGQGMLYGQGAGDLPTGSAVMADLMTVAKELPPDNDGFANGPLPKADIIDLDEAVSLHYLRFTVPDQPGVMRDIAGALADHDISIAQAVQQGEDLGRGVSIVFLTHEAKAGAIHAAMRQVEAMGLAKARTMHYRIM